MRRLNGNLTLVRTQQRSKYGGAWAPRDTPPTHVCRVYHLSMDTNSLAKLTPAKHRLPTQTGKGVSPLARNIAIVFSPSSRSHTAGGVTLRGSFAFVRSDEMLRSY